MADPTVVAADMVVRALADLGDKLETTNIDNGLRLDLQDGASGKGAALVAHPNDDGTTLADAPAYKRTAAEISAGVTPVDYRHEAGVFDRHGENQTPGTTDMATAINSANSARAQGGGGEVRGRPDTYAIGSTVTLSSAVALVGEGHANTIIKLLDSSNTDMVRSEDFSTLTGSGVSSVADGEPYGIQIKGIQFDGNQDNQTSGDGLKLYSKKLLLHDVMIADMKGVGLYTESGNATSSNSDANQTEMVESIFENLHIWNSGSYGWQMRGIHDSVIDKVFISLSGADGMRVEKSGTDYAGLCDIGFMHIYGSTLNGFYTEEKIKALHIESESNHQNGYYHAETGGNQSVVVFLEVFGNDFSETGDYWNAQILCSESIFATTLSLDFYDSAGGVKVTGQSNQFTSAFVKNTSNANSAAIGVDIDGAQTSFKGKISGYSTAGQTGLRTSNGAARTYLDIEANIENCYTGWNNVNAGLGAYYRLRINTTDKDHLLFTGAGPATFDPGGGTSGRSRETWDVIAINTGTSHSGTAQAGSATTITLASTASSRDDVYNGCIITLTGGTGSGAVGVVTDYVGSTKVATIVAVNGSTWTADSTTTYTCTTLTMATRTNGLATIPSGSTSIKLPHGLLITSVTPSARNVRVTPTNDLGDATKFWVSATDKHTFTISVDADPGADTATFAWDARLD